MEKEFVSYEQAVALKELGIYISPPCYSVYRKYNNLGAVLLYNAESMETIDLVAPLKIQVFKRFQENNLWFHAISYHRKAYPNTNQFKWKVDIGLDLFDCKGWSDTYEEAENACIDKLIELVKTNKQ
jgi:hypothetical protein